MDQPPFLPPPLAVIRPQSAVSGVRGGGGVPNPSRLEPLNRSGVWAERRKPPDAKMAALCRDTATPRLMGRGAAESRARRTRLGRAGPPTWSWPRRILPTPNGIAGHQLPPGAQFNSAVRFPRRAHPFDSEEWRRLWLPAAARAAGSGPSFRGVHVFRGVLVSRPKMAANTSSQLRFAGKGARSDSGAS